MPVALQGALIGLALGVVLTVFEWYALKKAVEERGKRLHKKLEMDEMEKRRINNVLRFSLLLPAGFALGFWIIWG
jgi:extradiol dioxygenase family protein